MIDRIIYASIRNQGLSFIFAAILILAGIFAFRQLPIDAVPDITNVQVTVNSQVEGLVPEEIEKFVTFPIESEMGGIPGVLEVRSISRFGLSQITIVFEEGFNIYLARQLVGEKLQGARDKLPKGIEPTLGPITTGLGEIYFYALEAKKPAENPEERLKQLMELRAINEYSIKPRLLMVKGVSEVNAIGGYEKQFHVKPRLDAMAKFGIDLDDVVKAIESNNRSTGGGYVQQTAEQLLIQAPGLITSEKQLETIVVKTLPNLRVIKLNDIADVGLGRELRTGAALVNGQESIIGTVLMLLGENSRTVSLDVNEKMQEIKSSLPEWANLETIYNRSTLVDSTLGTVEHNLFFGALLVVLILLLLIGNVRVAFITAATIPLALLGTFIGMKLFKVSGNLMSLGALDFGIIIDGAVIVMDNCVRHISQRGLKLGRTLTRDEIKESVSQATIEIRSAAGFGQLIIIIVFLPLFGLTGVEGKMFVPMAATFCFALLFAFVLSFSVIPALAAMFLPGKISADETKVMRWFKKIYDPILGKALRAKKAVLVGGAAAIVVGIVGFMTLGANFLPQLDEGSIAVQFVRPTNMSLDQSVEMQRLSEQVIREFPETDIVLSRIGTAEVATDPMGPNISDTYIMLKSKDHWPEVSGSKRTKAELIEAYKERLEALIPGQALIFSQPIQLRFNELLEGVRSDVGLKIFGEDMEIISEAASKAAAIIKTIPGAGDAEEETKGQAPVMRIIPKTAELAKLGTQKESLLSTVETALGGKEAGNLYEGVQRFPIIVRLNEEDRGDIDAVRSVPVGIVEDFTLPLHEVAEIKFEETYTDIRRESAKKRAAVLVNVRGRDTQSFIEEAKQRIESELKLPPGYYMEWGGSFKNLERARDRLLILVPLALALVLLMIYLAFRSILQTAMIAVCIPMALVGGVLGLIFNGLEFSISAAVGFIALSGIAVLNGVVLVSYFNKLKLEGRSGDDLIRHGTGMRLRPVMMTAAGAAFGFLPMMLSTGAGAEVQRPLAAVVVGGIISATILTLVVVPIAYRILESRLKVRENSMSH
ncbi:MAG: efflux RND transporter permease subunit [Deltaproteobacteria bacterium]|nr:efflux RND transporter permease subunit [Deltaproteobacteria bacterium]